MSLGRTIRAALGNDLSKWVGRYYRAVFVDLTKVAAVYSASIPINSLVLDVGGGDGEPLNYLLDSRPDLFVTLIDLVPVIGQWLEPRHAARVALMPSTSLAQYLALKQPCPDVLLLSDVMHHIPESERGNFFRSVAGLLQIAPKLRIIVKDVEPGFARSALGYWSDKYVTGDKQVSLIARSELEALVQSTLGSMRVEVTELFKVDKPNYAVVFFR